MNRLTCGIAGLMVAAVAAAAIAQEASKPPAAEDVPPVLTNEIRLEIKDRVKTMTDKYALTTPKAVGELVEQIMEARLRDAQAAEAEANAYIASLKRGDYVVALVDPQKSETWTYRRPEKK